MGAVLEDLGMCKKDRLPVTHTSSTCFREEDHLGANGISKGYGIRELYPLLMELFKQKTSIFVSYYIQSSI